MSGPSPRRVLAGTAAVTTVCVLPSFLLGAMAVQVGRDLGIDPSGIGLAFGAFFAAASVASAPLGRVTEARGPVWSLRLATVVTAGSCLATAAVGRSLATLLLPIAVAGAANALCQPAANLLIARAVPASRQGFAFAIKQSAIPFATLLAGVAVPALALTVGWRWAFVMAAGLAVVAGAGVPDVGRSGSGAGGSAGGPGGLGSKARRARKARPATDVPLPVMAALAVGIGFGAAAGGTLGSFLVSGAVDGGLSEGAAGWLLTAGSIAGITVRLLAGVQADRRDGGHLRVVALMLLLGAGAFGVLAIGTEWSYLLAGPAGFMTAWAWPGLFNLAVVRANPARPAAATGITQTGTYVGAVSGPLLFGFVAEHASFRVAWLVAAAFALVGSAAMLAGRRALRAWRASAAAVDATGAVSL